MNDPLLKLFRSREGDVPFTPDQVLNLAAWYDASDTSTITQASGAVSQWNDKSGNGYHLTQVTGSNQPLTGAGSMNGRNVLSFDGADYLSAPSGLLSLPSGDNTVFMVYKLENATKLAQNIYSFKDGGNARYRIIANLNAVNDFIGTNHTNYTQNASLVGGSDLSAHITTLKRNGTSVVVTLDSIVSSTQVAASFTAIIGAVGNFATGGSTGMVGQLAEVIFYARALEAREINQVGQYLANKWGVTWTDQS